MGVLILRKSDFDKISFFQEPYFSAENIEDSIYYMEDLRHRISVGDYEAMVDYKKGVPNKFITGYKFSYPKLIEFCNQNQIDFIDFLHPKIPPCYKFSDREFLSKSTLLPLIKIIEDHVMKTGESIDSYDLRHI